MSLKSLCFAFILLIFISNVNAQEFEYEFKRLTVKDGLSHNNVYTIIQDKDGYMWFGTQDGLNKYDGYKISIFRHEPNNSNSLTTGNFGKIYQDSEGIFWFGTYGGGIDRYDPKTNLFKNYSNKPNDPSSLSNNQITFFFKDSKGEFWIGTASGGLNKLNINTGTFTRYIHNPNDSTTLSHIRSKCICETSDGTLWIGTGNGLNKFDRNTGQFERYFTDPNNKNSLSSNSIQYLLVDKNDIIWIGTRNGGLNKFDPKKGSFKHFMNDPDNPKSISDNTVEYLFIDSFDQFWIGTYKGGLNLFDRSKEEFKCFKHNPNKDNSISSDRVEYIFEDKSKILWIATRGGGINTIDLKPNKFNNIFPDPNDDNSLPHPSVMAIESDDKGNLWIGTDGGGLSVFDPKQNKYENLKTELSDNSLSGNRVWSLLFDHEGILWIGTYLNGLNRLEIKNGKYIFNRYQQNDGSDFPTTQVNCIAQDNHRDIWLGTPNGLVKLIKTDDPKNYHFKTYTQNKIDSDGFVDNYISSVYIDSKQRMWIGSYIGGLFQFIPESEKFISYSPSKLESSEFKNDIHVVNIYESKDHKLLVGTESNGLLEFDPKKKIFKNHPKNDQLLSNMIMGLLYDNEGNLWISTSRGLSKYSSDDNKLFNYTNTDGIESEGFYRNSIHKYYDGKIFVGSNAGITCFSPGDDKVNRYIPQVVITDFRVLNESKWDSMLIAYQNFLYNDKEIVLTHKDYFFSFEFASLDFTSPEDNEYKYMLEGFDKDWISVSNTRKATYTNIDPGEYIFKVIGSNNDKLWNETPTTIKIKVLPPIWKKPWFYLLEVLTGLFIILLYIRSRTKSLLRDKKVLEEKVHERTKEIHSQKEELEYQAEELANANEELKNHKDHLENIVKSRTEDLEIAKNRAEESDKIKSAFLANMSHEIRTPMNAIIGFSNLINEKELSKEKTKELTSYIVKNSDTLLHLIDDIIDLSKIEAGQLEIFKENCNVNELFNDLKDIYKEKSIHNNSNNTELRFLINKSSNVILFTDVIRLRQILINLIDNAVKFTEEGYIEVGYTIENDEKIIFHVKDTGIGMSEKQLNKVFVRFTKLESERKKIYRGAGLGLSICKNIIKLLDGSIWVESKEDIGSVFYFSLPYNKMLTLNNDKETSNDSNVLPDFTDKTILIAEDEESNFKLLQMLLEETNINIIHALDGDDAFNKFKEHSVDLILMDVKMPGTDGISAVKEIRKADKDIPVIAQTAYAMENDKTVCINAGCNGYISKPIDKKKLFDLLLKYLK